MKKKITLFQSLIPLLFLLVLLGYNVIFAFKDNAILGSNQFILVLSAAIGIAIGTYNGVSFENIIAKVSKNIKNTTTPIIILFFVGALSGTWLISGIIPAMIFYGMKILNPSIFLSASVIICALVSSSTGSSWTTSATIGIALMGIGKTLGIPLEICGGAIISGAYFGDKMSPMSDTTNLAATVSGTDLFTHIRYMMLTTVPSIILTLIIFTIIGFSLDLNQTINSEAILQVIDQKFNITPWLFIVPALVIFMVIKKIDPLIALFFGIVLAVIATLIFQQDLLYTLTKNNTSFTAIYQVIMQAITQPITIETQQAELNDLLTSKGMSGMLNTIWLIIFAMLFGGVMEAIGALKKITELLLQLFHSTFGLFASTIASCLALNITTSDQYLAIVVPGKMFAKAYQKKGLAPENLSRTLEDSATVTSVLIPWNTCAAYNSGVLGVDTLAYAPYAFFNIISPFSTLLFAAFHIKIKQLKKKITSS